MKIYRTTNGEYIPDPVHVDYSLLDDGTSTRQLLILALNKKRGDVFLHPSSTYKMNTYLYTYSVYNIFTYLIHRRSTSKGN